MKTHVMILLLGIVVIWMAVEGSLGPGIQSRCKCIRTTSVFIHPRRYRHIDVFPRNLYCRRMEIIITLKNKKVVCINPVTPWVKKIVVILSKQRQNVP
uniref:Interleukin-8 n=1 Tax=Callorhinchus milii TaxID=7868 RepID=V9LIZ5_CALMI